MTFVVSVFELQHCNTATHLLLCTPFYLECVMFAHHEGRDKVKGIAGDIIEESLLVAFGDHPDASILLKDV